VLSAIAVMAAAVWVGGQAQRGASQHSAEEVAVSHELLTSRLDMETGLRGFLLTGQESYLEPYRVGLDGYERAMEEARNDAHAADSAVLDEQDRVTERWLALANAGILGRRDGVAPTRQQHERRVLMDRFREANESFADEARTEGDRREQEALRFVVGLIIALGLAGLAAGYILVERPAAIRRRRRVEMNEFGELLQFSASEREAHDLVRRQLERTVPDSSATVFTINNSESRLQAATEVEEETPLGQRLRAATPNTCLAVRRGKDYRRRHGEESLIECELCGGAGTSSICTPALVGGEIIGSVLVTRDGEEISDRTVSRIEETTTLAAPVLGNLRNLAVAETRAVTDSLTGLANSRAATETLRVMAAYAGRSAQPLSTVLVDLDRFKQINDNYGHPIGDEVLAAAAKSMKGTIRASDFIARYGGEEFLILLQGTDQATAAEVAEKVRRDLAHLRVPGFTGRVSASFGVATIPTDAGDPDGVLRCADEALYAAKNAGRDQVTVYRERPDSVEPLGQAEGLEGHL
jgi:diguanylate cyclase (GGDEF)-like protein